MDGVNSKLGAFGVSDATQYGRRTIFLLSDSGVSPEK